jgi:hypothetical protein
VPSHVETLHRHVKVQRLNPFDGDAKGVIVTQIVELGAIFALDRLDPQHLSTPVRDRGGSGIPAPAGKVDFT